MELDESSVIYPYNAYVNPSTYLGTPTSDVKYLSSKMQRMLVPSLMPKGLDPSLLLEERNRQLEARIAWRQRELENLFANGSDQMGAAPVPGVTHTHFTFNGRPIAFEGKPVSSGNLRALNELRALRLREKQKMLREDVVRDMNAVTALPTERTEFRRFRNFAVRDARSTEEAERKQREAREAQSKNKHTEYITGICDHGRDLIRANRSADERARRLGTQIARMHRDTEKEEQKRIERLSKERLKALKNDDEAGYRALIDQAKDHRISHLLARTDAYLDSLADQIQVQKKDIEDGGLPRSQQRAASAAVNGQGADGEAEPKLDYNGATHQIKEKVTEQAKMLSGGTLKSYQVSGLEWMVSLHNNKLNGILADEMGLGKTIQTLALITYLIEKKGINGPFLVIVPLSTITNWQSEFNRWAPTVQTIVLKGAPATRRVLLDQIKRVNEWQVVLTTYEYITRQAEAQVMSKIKWHHMIIDEGHRMKNAKSKLALTLNEKYSTKYRLILTGTPLQNNIPELWALLNFVLPKVFNSVKSFDDWFNAPFSGTGNTADKETAMTEEEKLLVVKGLHKVLRPFLLRRLKKDVESELPDKVESIIKVKMSALQTQLYNSLRLNGRMPSDDTQPRARQQDLQNLIIQLRKVCQHPFVFPEVEQDIDSSIRHGGTSSEAIWRSAGKFELLDRILPKLFATGHKCLMFFQWVMVIDVMEDYLNYKGVKFCRLDGSTKQEVRQDLLTHFNDKDSEYQIFLLSTRAGGLGLNLQSADTVIIFDSDYNPHADLQAQDRAHRIGQKKEVRVFRLVTSNTVEENIIEVAKRKLALDGQIIQAGKFDGHTSAEDRELFLRSLLEVNNEENEDDAEPDEETLNQILARGDEELVTFARMDEERAASDAIELGGRPRLMPLEELPRTYRAEVKKASQETKVDDFETGPGKRARKEVNYSDDRMTDDQWLRALEDDGDEDVEESAARRRTKAQNQANPRKGDSTANNSRLASPALMAGPKGKARKGKMMLMADSPDGDDGDDTPERSLSRKRGRESPSVSVADDEQKLPVKRQKFETKLDESVSQLYKQAMSSLWQAVNTMDDDEGNRLAYGFDDQYKGDPAYDAMILKPMWLKKIKNKLNRYRGDWNEFKSDMLLMLDNAMLYNQDGSLFYNNAQTMKEKFLDLWNAKMEELGLDEDGNAPVVVESAPVPAPKRLMLKINKPVATSTLRKSTPVPKRGGGKSTKRKKIESSDEDEGSQMDESEASESDDE